MVPGVIPRPFCGWQLATEKRNLLKFNWPDSTTVGQSRATRSFFPQDIMQISENTWRYGGWKKSAPVDRRFIPFVLGFQPSRWCRISSIHSMMKYVHFPLDSFVSSFAHLLTGSRWHKHIHSGKIFKIMRVMLGKAMVLGHKTHHNFPMVPESPRHDMSPQ